MNRTQGIVAIGVLRGGDEKGHGEPVAFRIGYPHAECKIARRPDAAQFKPVGYFFFRTREEEEGIEGRCASPPDPALIDELENNLPVFISRRDARILPEEGYFEPTACGNFAAD